MTPNNGVVGVKKDMLSLLSSVQEVLRALYFYSTDYILVCQGKHDRLLHKEQLVALLEQGREKATLEDMTSMNLNEPLAAKMKIEDIPSDTLLLLFVQTGDADGELERITFGEQRERKIEEQRVLMPDWWNIPLPLLHIDDDRVFLNDFAARLIPGGSVSLANQIDRLRRERIAIVKEKRRERTFSLSPLTEDTYFIEDISGDFEMAEDLVWWAAAGKAFVERMKGNGLIVKRLSPYEETPEGAAEVFPCVWEGELVGSIVLELPQAEAIDDGEAAKKPARRRKKTTEELEETKETGAPDVADTPEAAEPAAPKIVETEAAAQGNGLRKTGAKRAYGMKGSVAGKAGSAKRDTPGQDG